MPTKPTQRDQADVSTFASRRAAREAHEAEHGKPEPRPALVGKVDLSEEVTVGGVTIRRVQK